MVPSFSKTLASIDVSKRWEKTLPSTLDPERQVAGAMSPSDGFGFLTRAVLVILRKFRGTTGRWVYILRRPT